MPPIANLLYISMYIFFNKFSFSFVSQICSALMASFGITAFIRKYCSFNQLHLFFFLNFVSLHILIHAEHTVPISFRNILFLNTHSNMYSKQTVLFSLFCCAQSHCHSIYFFFRSTHDFSFHSERSILPSL